ncbi:nucleotidyltransferase family protein [bacterium]|nr:nucleotidyltransferase family protein [bacterium]
MASRDDPRIRLDKAAEIDDILDRRLFTLAVITWRLQELGITPVLVGGGAVQFYTLGGYTTKDIDVVMPTSPKVEDAMSELGFIKRGRYWVREDIDIAIEAPSASLSEGMARVIEVQIDDMLVCILGIEDLIIDRLNAYVHWKSTEDGRWASRLITLGGKDMDWEYIIQRAEEERVSDALNDLAKSAGI